MVFISIPAKTTIKKSHASLKMRYISSLKNVAFIPNKLITIRNLVWSVREPQQQQKVHVVRLKVSGLLSLFRQKCHRLAGHDQQLSSCRLSELQMPSLVNQRRSWQQGSSFQLNWVFINACFPFLQLSVAAGQHFVPAQFSLVLSEAP